MSLLHCILHNILFHTLSVYFSFRFSTEKTCKTSVVERKYIIIPERKFQKEKINLYIKFQ